MADSPRTTSGFLDWLALPAILAGLGLTFKEMIRSIRKPVTLEYPEKRHHVPAGYRGEHRLKKDPLGRVKCVACYMCATACPSRCIRIVAEDAPWDDRDKKPAAFEIDLMRCIYCGMCEEACPCDAIELTGTYNQVATSRDEKIHDMERLLNS